MIASPPNPVFITGATGFVGSHIARRYLAAGHTVSALKRPTADYGMLTNVAEQITWHHGDLLDIPSLEAAIRSGVDTSGVDTSGVDTSGVDTSGCDVIHAAAVVSFAPKDRRRMERANVEGTANLVNVCLKAGVRKLGYVSSVAALGRPPAQTGTADAPVVIDERQKWEDSPNNSFYAQTKYRAELEVWRGVAEGLNAVLVCPSIVLGAGDWSRSSLQLIRYVADENPVYPAGLANYVDVLDVADALYELMQSDLTNQRYVLNGGTIPYRRLLEQIAAGLHKRPPTTRASPALTRVLWPLEAVRAWLTGREPLITRETARSAGSAYRYDGRRIEQALGFQYRPLAETIGRIAAAFGTALPGS